MSNSALLALFLWLPTLPGDPGDELRLARALDTIEAREIRSDLFFFASDEMRGRDTPSKEQRVAARFVRARLERLGFEPGAGTSFFHEYPLQQRRIDPARSSLAVLRAPKDPGQAPEVALELVFGKDYFFPSSSDIAVLEREGPVAWCGKGERDDFAAARGRWAVCLASDTSARRRARYAEGAGALGVITLPDPAGTADPAAADCQKTTKWALDGLNERSSDRDGFLPQACLSLDAGRRLLAACGVAAGLPPVGELAGVSLRDLRAGSGAIPLENVCALWPGSDPVLSKEILIVSAHYDHEGVKGGKIYPGADDNGSGSMGLLALAEALSEYGPMRRSVLLMWVSGEEKGLWGSAAWTKSPTLPEGYRAVCDLNIDMIGRNAPDYLLITPTKALKEYNGLTRLAEELGPGEGFPKLGSADEYWQRSDHMNFAENMKIPVAFLFSDVHADYHKPTDTPDKIDYDKIRRVTRLVLRMLDRLQVDELKL
jgi:peptidase M28-like protein